jgi:hypothetical protein
MESIKAEVGKEGEERKGEELKNERRDNKLLTPVTVALLVTS